MDGLVAGGRVEIGRAGGGDREAGGSCSGRIPEESFGSRPNIEESTRAASIRGSLHDRQREGPSICSKTDPQ